MAAALALLAGVATLVWALFWPDSTCSEPACARRRFAVAVELDAFKQVDPIELAVKLGDKRVSLHSIFASGGVDATVVQGQSDLPYKASSGALDRADLYQVATAWRNAESGREVDASIYALLAPALVSDTGEPLSMRGETMPTYSDQSLRPWGPSLQFCFNEATLRQPVRGTISRLVQQLRRERPRRIVIVGHGDHEGTCRYNDALGLRRAEAVRRALTGAGLHARRVELASLGERRPLDFAATTEAHDLNRRVEILIESRNAPGVDLPAIPRIAPVCGAVAQRVQTAHR